MKEPCIDCPEKKIDDYGYFCDLHCGKRTAWFNHQEGIREVVEWVDAHIWQRTTTREEWELQKKEWGI